MSQQLHGFFRRRVKDDQLAQDLVQDTFLRIHNNLGALQDQERLAAWVYRIATSTLADHFRKSFVSKEILTNDFTLTNDQPEENYNEDVAGWLGQMVQNLPLPYRAAVEMAELAGVTQREVSDRLGISLSGAKSRVQRGREKLKDQLLQCCHIEFDRHGNITDYGPRTECHACCTAAPANKSCGPR
jgi:RNA polymerase sigma-70 factor (ECF subfamily)